MLNPQRTAAKYAGQTVTVTGAIVGREGFTTMKGADAGGVIAATAIVPAAGKAGAR
ncbi:MAG: hypothetical protein ACRD1L_10885 [Terriglobales bacterium]